MFWLFFIYLSVHIKIRHQIHSSIPSHRQLYIYVEFETFKSDRLLWVTGYRSVNYSEGREAVNKKTKPEYNLVDSG